MKKSTLAKLILVPVIVGAAIGTFFTGCNKSNDDNLEAKTKTAIVKTLEEEITPGTPRFYLIQAEKSMKEGNYQKAIKILEEDVDVDIPYGSNATQDAPAWMLLLNCYFHAGDHEKTIKKYRECAERFVGWENGAINKQIELWKTGTEMFSDDGDLWNELGHAYKKADRFDDAVIAYTKAVETSPDYIYYVKNLGDALEKAGKNKEAITEFKKVVAWYDSEAKRYSSSSNDKEKKEFEVRIEKLQK